ncbi:isochorismatase family cysteine hydrolase [Burkholderia sp. Ac-20353]|uniref:isochorismatase family cysteine hydrolase n=1 Tax=Burkholderia sp. Ac-20353 TaxID=2703894 RepID=UPI00197C30C7|nr:isochorismatase family cysteine hydrolase [Burkholderia sp. Ac-20353]MBN3785758.1 cysteine hydrolase [Burkholderia sp. Ac-20353]
MTTSVNSAGSGSDGTGSASGQRVDPQIPVIVPAKTALVVMHYQTDILGLFPSVAPALLANTRKLCDAARAKGIGVYFANLRFSPGYPEVSPLNKNGQGIKRLGLFVDDRTSPELGPQANEPLIVAHRASVFFGTDLEARLSAQGVDSLIMVGIASTGVVLSSVAYASDADFRLYTVKDCCYDPDQVVHEHLFSTAFDSRTTVLSLADALLLLARAFDARSDANPDRSTG